MKKIIRDEKVYDFCKNIIKDEKLTEDEVHNLSSLINQQSDVYESSKTYWPTHLPIKPLQNAWHDGVLEADELKELGKLIFSIVYNEEIKKNKAQSSQVKTCPKCKKVLMSSIVPICSWCGIKLNHDEMYVGTSDFIQKQKIKDAWTEVLDKKTAQCYDEWFGRLYHIPISHNEDLMYLLDKYSVGGIGGSS